MSSFEFARGLGFNAMGNLDEEAANNDADETLWIATSSRQNMTMLDVPVPQEQEVNAAIAAAQARAKRIVEKFQNQRSVITHATASHQHDFVCVANHGSRGQDEAERRRLWLLREQHRLQAAVVKNLDYLAHQERFKLNQLNDAVEYATAMEQMAGKSYQQRLERRRQKLLGTNSLPGHNKHNRTGKTTKEKRGTGDVVLSKDASKKPRCSSSAALYISGLDKESDHEELLQSLFSSFGPLQRIHFYRDKATNVRKGDGLVIYDLVDDPDRSHILLESVCGQLNGLELPNGNVLHVEVAFSSNAVIVDETAAAAATPPSGRTNVQENTSVLVSPPLTSSVDSTIIQQGAGGADPELDDFFDSL